MSERTTDYYDQTAARYDAMHGGSKDMEHIRALEFLSPLITDAASILDVGSGTGRSLSWFQSRYPTANLYGVEPSNGLIDVALKNVPGAMIVQGFGERLPHPDASMDLVTATGIMHHVDDSPLVISEMFRVSRQYVLISDHNNFAFGGRGSQKLRLALHLIGALSAFQFVKQGFRRQGYSEDDGWWYPYSLLSSYGQICRLSERVYITPTRPSTGEDFFTGQSHLAILALKKGAVESL